MKDIIVGAVAALLAGAAAGAGTDLESLARDAQRRVFDLELVPPSVDTHPDLRRHGFDRLDFALNGGMARTRGGRLVAVWHAGADGPKAYLVGTWSDDDGRTWAGTKFVLGSPDPLFNLGIGADVYRSILIANVWAAPDGTLRLYAYQAINQFDQRGALFEIICRDPDAAEPVWEPARFLCYGSVHNKPIVLKDGTWVIPADFEYCAHLAGNAFPDLDPLRGCAALASTDQGRTWVRRGAVPPTKEDTHACEHSIVERPDGRLHMFLRTFGGLKESESADGGRTWSAPKLPDAIRQPVARFAYIRLASGKLLVVKNGFTPMEIVTRTDKAGKPVDPWWTARSRLTAFVSDDEGKTWKGGLRIDPRARVAYPDAFQAPDGSIYVTYDHDRNTKKDELLFAKFTEADVLAGRLVTAGSSLRNVIFSEGGHPGSVSGKQEEGKGNEDK